MGSVHIKSLSFFVMLLLTMAILSSCGPSQEGQFGIPSTTGSGNPPDPIVDPPSTGTGCTGSNYNYSVVMFLEDALFMNKTSVNATMLVNVLNSSGQLAQSTSVTVPAGGQYTFTKVRGGSVESLSIISNVKIDGIFIGAVTSGNCMAAKINYTNYGTTGVDPSVSTAQVFGYCNSTGRTGLAFFNYIPGVTNPGVRTVRILANNCDKTIMLNPYETYSKNIDEICQWPGVTSCDSYNFSGNIVIQSSATVVGLASLTTPGGAANSIFSLLQP